MVKEDSHGVTELAPWCHHISHIVTFYDTIYRSFFVWPLVFRWEFLFCKIREIPLLKI